MTLTYGGVSTSLLLRGEGNKCYINKSLNKNETKRVDAWTISPSVSELVCFPVPAREMNSGTYGRWQTAVETRTVFIKNSTAYDNFFF